MQQKHKTLLAVVILISILTVMLSCSHDYKMDAWVLAQHEVEKKLKSPSTAKFCTYPEASVIDRGEGEYRVTGWVDAQNSFGAITRVEFRVDVTFDSSGKCTDISAKVYE